MDVLSSPFRFLGNGRAATVVQFSDDDVAQKIASLMQTEPGELPLAPHFGIHDPTFRSVRSTEIEAAIVSFYPGVTVNDVRMGIDGAGETAIEIYFTNNTEE